MTGRTWGLMAAVVAVITGVAAYLGSPFLAFDNLKEAARSGDRDRLEQIVDFPAVRDNLKSSISAKFVKSISAGSGTGDNAVAAISALFAPVLLDRMIDIAVTPEGIATLLSQGRLSKPGDDPSPKVDARKNDTDLETQFSYRTIDRFRITLQFRGDADAVELTMERRGLFVWKLIRIDMPEAVLRSPAPNASTPARP